MAAKDYFQQGKEWIKKSIGETKPSPSNRLRTRHQEPSIITGDEEVRKQAEKFGLKILEHFPEISLSRELLSKVPYSFAKRYVTLPYALVGDEVLVTLHDPLNLAPLEELRILLGKPVRGVWCSKEQIMTAINDCYNTESGAASQLIADLKETQEDLGIDENAPTYDLLDAGKEQSSIIKLLNLIITEAIQQNASDIHFEPFDDTLRIRYRIDGVLHNRHSPASEHQSQLLTRLKVMSKMDIAERRLPQDGRIKLRMGRREVDFRVSTVPVEGGERIVMRILDKGNITLGLDRIGMPSALLDEFTRLCKLPEGIILVTGPTGSGKTTTLYSAVSDLKSDEINIMTIEDPVEYNLKGIAQIGVKPQIDLTFAAGLRTILRQDPDVVMVGEIRDAITAEIAIQASLTGHLVLSTLHTNDAPSAITRLVDMGVEPYLLSSSLVGVLAQRLVRRICSHCQETYKPSQEEIDSLGLKLEELPGGLLFHGTGCDHCFHSGYHGRHGVYELLTVDHVIQQQIVKSPDAIALRKVSLAQGMHPLRAHGAELVKQGITTVSEILRVIRGIEEV